MRPVTVVGHRGDPYRVRENTLPSIASAIERGADAVEVDVRLTKDGVPVLLHDDTLKRLWGHDRPLSSLTHEQLRELTRGGVPTLRDALLAHLAEQRIALEVCPTSNIATRAVATLDEHPIRQMVDAGVLVTVNSDDPPMFGTDLNTEYAVAARLLGLDERGLAALAKNAVEASFLDAAGKARIAAEIDTYTDGWLAR